MLSKRLWLLLFPVFIACDRVPDNQGDDFIIQGNILHAEGSVLLLEELTTSENIFIDSIYTGSDGRFAYRNELNDAAFYIIRAGKGNSITLLIEPGERIHITGDASNLAESYKVEGSAGSVLLSALTKKQMSNMFKVDSLVRILRANKYESDIDEIRKDVNEAYLQIFADQQHYVKEFIDQHPGSLASVIALYQYFGNKLLLTESDHFSYFETLSKSLSEKYPYNKHVIDLKRRVGEYKRTRAQRMLAEELLTPGNMAPEIILPGPDGKNVALSSLRGNYVLIDFWAAWCPPCRQANRYLKRIYDDYAESGFEIYAVSLDRTREQWVLGIEEDEIGWVQVSDLRFWSSPVVSLYNIESIPFTVLIDREGRIIDKGLNPREVRRKLEELLSP